MKELSQETKKVIEKIVTNRFKFKPDPDSIHYFEQGMEAVLNNKKLLAAAGYVPKEQSINKISIEDIIKIIEESYNEYTGTNEAILDAATTIHHLFQPNKI